MIESFLYGTWIGGQVLYWFFLKSHTALGDEECWWMLNGLAYRDVQSGYLRPGARSTMRLEESEAHRK